MSNIEQRLEAIEHFQRLIMGSSLGLEIRGLDLRRKQAQLDGVFEREKVDKREAAGPQRQAALAKFIKERLSVESGAECAGWGVAFAYEKFAKSEGLSADLIVRADELFAAVEALAGVEPVIVRAGQLNGKHEGYSGVCVVPEFRHEYDASAAQEKPVTTGIGVLSNPTTAVAGARMI